MLDFAENTLFIASGFFLVALVLALSGFALLLAAGAVPMALVKSVFLFGLSGLALVVILAIVVIK